MEIEPILKPNPFDKRFSLFPIRHADMWNLYKEASGAFWQVEEIVLAKDIEDWQNLPAEMRRWLSRVLAFFQVADGLVNENLINTFSREVQIPEARSFFGMQIAVENIHQETYALLVETLIQDEKEKAQLFDALNSFPSILAKAKWCEQWTDDEKPFAERLIAWACTEFIMFSSSFAAIFYVKAHFRSMPGLCFSNELIARDEGLHARFACLLFRKLHYPPSLERIHEIVRSAVQSEQAFVRDSMKSDTSLHVKSTDMEAYVEYVADMLCTMLGIEKIYQTPLPESLQYMQLIDLPGKTNYFEKRNSAYSIAPPRKMQTFSIEEHF